MNVDGLKAIEDDHNLMKVNNKILEKRKKTGNPDLEFRYKCPEKVNKGVDLNRNYGVDWQLTELENLPDYECSEFYAGSGPFSEKETQAMKTFLESVKSDLRFVINFHSNGPAFIWAFNGR